MSAFKSDFLRILSERGFIQQISDEAGLDDLFAKETVSAYIGFDATARSLHAGSLIQIMMLHWMQKTGHRPIALMGGGTSMIGDPSFKDEARKLLTLEDIEDNLAGIRRNFAPYLRFGDRPSDALMVNNADWLMDINYVSFLRDVGRHFSVNRMLAFELGETEARPGAVPFISRVQLHDPAGLRLRGAEQAPRRAAPDGRLRPVGKYRQRHRPGS